MECPHCQKEIQDKECPECGGMIPQESRYCMYCGTGLEVPAENSTGQGDELDLENRELCPDGTCTGIIINGACSECGKPQ